MSNNDDAFGLLSKFETIHATFPIGKKNSGNFEFSETIQTFILTQSQNIPAWHRIPDGRSPNYTPSCTESANRNFSKAHTYLESRPRKTFLHPSVGDTRFLMVVLSAKQKQSNLRASPKLYMFPNRAAAAAAGSAFSYLIIYERFEFEFCTEPKNFCASCLFHLPCSEILSMMRVERVEASKEKHNLTLCVLSVSLLPVSSLSSSSDPVADV